MRVSCFGSNEDQPAVLYNEMVLVGRLLAARGVGIATGAFSGIGMQAPLEGARGSGFGVPIVGYTYGSRAANPYVTDVVDCRALANAIPFDSDYCLRLAGLLSSDAFIVAGGGGPGTFLELIATINFNQKFWSPMKRTAILEPRDTSMWNKTMLDALKLWGILSGQVAESIRVVNSAERAVRWVCEGTE
jgi:predicted Rossmann-fold nucleotide-binding protein